MSNLVCKCGKGYASEFDSMCCYCRATTFRKAELKKKGIRHYHGVTLDQAYGPEVKQMKLDDKYTCHISKHGGVKVLRNKESVNFDLDNVHFAAIHRVAELHELLCEISNMCMSSKLDSNLIGQRIYEVTGLTNPQLNKVVNDNE